MTQAPPSSVSSIWSALARSADRYPKEMFPMVSVIIPTWNHAQYMPQTIESLLSQDYASYEILVIDASSTDRTVEVVESYRSEQVFIYSVAYYHIFEMWNKGIALAQGEYLNFLLPGDFVLYKNAFKHMMSIALDTGKPNLVYSGSLCREVGDDVQILFHPFTENILRQGLDPTLLHACWIHKELLHQAGKFSTQYQERGEFEFFCRIAHLTSFTFAFSTRVLVDSGYRRPSRHKVFMEFLETCQLLRKNFGIRALLRYFITQKEIPKLWRYTWEKIKIACMGR